jgi:membrane protease YdiL (CAAX protease family)
VKPAWTFLAIVFLISWGGGVPFRSHALALFPILILSVAAAGIGCAKLFDGSRGVQDLWKAQTRWALGRWYGLMLLPPALILAALFLLSAIAGPSFAPNFFPVGLAFGIPAGLFEEIGWTGFLLPKLTARLGWKRASVVLGVVWGVWHLPVIDALGAATPHRGSLPAFFFAFILLLTGLRIIMSWAAVRTRSIAIAQLVHASSTGSLVMFGPKGVTPAQEAFWYAGYGVLLWIVAAAILATADTERSD